MKKEFKKPARITGYIALFLFLLLVAGALLLQLPSVQTFVAKKATSLLAKKTGGRISIGKAAIRLPDAVRLKDIYVEDLQGDTLLYASVLKVNISLFSLLGKKITIDDVLLEDAVVNINEDLRDSTFNFQFLADAFAGDTTQPTDTTPSAWKFTISKVELNNVRAKVDAPGSGFAVQGTIGEFSVDADKFDIEKRYMDFGNVSLKHSVVAIHLFPRDSSVIEKIDTLTKKSFLIPAFGWIFKADEIDFEDNAIAFDNSSKAPTQGLDFAHLRLSKLNIQIKDAVYEGHMVKADIQNISTTEKSGLQLKQLKGNISIDTTGITLNKLKVETNRSHIVSNAIVKFPDVNALMQLSKDVSVDFDFKESYISVADVMLVMPQFAENENFNLGAIDSLYIDGSVSGTINDLKGKDLNFSVGQNANVNLNFTATGLPDIDYAYFNLNIQELKASPILISKIIRKELPEQVTRLGMVNLKGKYKGTIRDMNFNGMVSTSLGNLDANLTAQFNKEYTKATYEGTFNLDKFQLGNMLADTTIGPLTLEASVKGSGLSLDDINADLKATIKEAVYRTYNYKDIAIDGSLDKKKFTGKANINDDNLRFDFAGLADFSDSLPAFRFEALLDTVNLGALHLMTNNVGIGADFAVDFKGLSIDKFDGYATIKDLHLSSDSLYYSMDSIVAKAYSESPDIKILEVASPVVNVKLNGDFNAADLPRLLINYVNDYFPVYFAVDSVDKPPRLAIEPNRPAIADQKFDILITVSKPLTLVKMFVPQITKFDTAYVVGSFDSKEKSLQLNAVVPGLQYDSIKVDTIHVIAAGNKSDLRFTVHMDNTDYNGNTNIPNAAVSVSMAKENMDISVNIDGDSIRRLGLGAAITRQLDGAYRISLNDSLTINGAKWSVPGNNYTDFHKGYLFFHNVRLQHNEQELSVSSPQDSVGAPINVGFKNFQLRELSDLADYNEIKMDGSINGTVTLRDTYTHPAFTADLNIKDVAFNDNPVGDIALKAVQQPTDIDVTVNLAGGENKMLISGKFSPATSVLNLSFDMQHLNLNVADPFLRDIISDSKGYLTASMRVTGKFTEPDISGSVSFHDMSTKVAYPNARFAIADNSIDITPERIAVNKLEIFDEEKRSAIVNGYMTHKYFRDIQLDLTLNTGEFLFMNTDEMKNNFFYGKVVLAINGSIKGSVALPAVDARASTRPGTQVFIAPLAMEENIKQEDFVIFQSPPFDEDMNPDSIVLARQQYEIKLAGIDLHLAFELTPDAELQIIIDPLAGDKLICKGSANLIVDVPPAGDPQITGACIVESGSYSFSYQRLLRRELEISKGSRIDFAGDVMDARLALTAVYTANAIPYDLIAAQSASLSPSEIEESKKRTPVNVVLHIGGQLSQPELTFDIQLPPDKSNLVSNTAARRLSQMREDPTELNKQVFALLMFNNFIADESTGPNLEAAGENVVLRSVSNLVSNQLNRLANKVEGFEINLDLSSYKSKYETEAGNDMITNVGLNVSKQFFDHRLQVTVGGDVNVENATSGQSKGGLSNITGDFSIEYKLTESGKFRVKVFQTGDYDILNQSNVYRTGVGLTYRESFRRLLQRAKEKDKENKNSSL